MSRKKWEVAACDKELARDIADECGIDSLVALILVSRGACDPFEVEEFLSDDQQLCDPFELADMDKAVESINRAIENGTKICVYGDYDADGVTSTAMLYTYLRDCGANVVYTVPERTDGYGLTMTAIDKAKADGIGLLVTVDNGINAIDEIAYANSLGIVTVVTDHHLPLETIPDAAAVVDPHRVDCPSYFKEYSGAGVAFKLICALSGATGEEMCEKYADLAAIGTVADVMKLTGENRILVRRGIENLETARPAFKALIDAAGIKRKRSGSSAISYGIAPRLNAAGRVGSCIRAVKLLIEQSPDEAEKIAEEINEANVQRQRLERDISEQSIKLIERERLQYDRVIVVCGSGWHHGVIGIVASRICERYGKPAVIMSDEGQSACGSARSVGDFSMYEAIRSCSDMLERFGGHAQAAGLTMPLERVEEFRRRINEYAREHYGDMPFAELKIDCKLRPAAFTPSLVHSLDVLAPFGSGNPVPVFGLFGMKLEKVTAVGNGNHLRLDVDRDGRTVTVMLFGHTVNDFGYRTGDVIDFAVTADVNEYMNREQVTLICKAYRPSGENEPELLEQMRHFERLMRGEDPKEELITRDDIVKVYRAIGSGFSGDEEALLIRLGELGYYKMRLALAILSQLKIIDLSIDGSIIRVAVNKIKEKMRLESSELYQKAGAV